MGYARLRLSDGLLMGGAHFCFSHDEVLHIFPFNSGSAIMLSCSNITRKRCFKSAAFHVDRARACTQREASPVIYFASTSALP